MNAHRPAENSQGMNDDVDAIIEAWETQRPDFSVEPLAIFSRMLRLSRHIERMRKRVFSRHGLETWEFEMLAALRRQHDYQLTAGQLMKETLVSSGTVTNRLDRMEVKGLLQRFADEHDGRVVHVKATDTGITLVDGAMKDMLVVGSEILEPYSAEENAATADYLRRLLHYFEDCAC